ncbi:SNF2-related protein [Paenibacillus larvae]|uniref:SNF2-related protein n=1 Tax=Paenibacillus larvae TaxID=1464 RepID=UPI00288DFDC1|nr:SNF2-related protein [Paenibacillus larvae]MDT2172778.1 SNF2-related protein [Paenibacillus larvae]MDT2245994.1 SNF2-related protein [Paenibacillus larvae]
MEGDSIIKLFPHQVKLLEQTKAFNRVAYYASMGLGKTFLAGEKHRQLGAPIALVVCQKSKIEDWAGHFEQYYNYPVIKFDKQSIHDLPQACILIINYDRIWRRPEIRNLSNYTLICDESSYLANEKAKRTKFIMSLSFDNLILLSGTPTGGKYEQLWAQAQLLGWRISKKLYWDQYIKTKTIENVGGFPIRVITGYKNIDRLKGKLRQHGAIFMTTDDAGIVLPEKVDTILSVKKTKQYREFQKHRMIEIDGKTLVGDATLTKMLYLRQLAGMYNPEKPERLRELLESTSDRVIVFYNFRAEFEVIQNLCQTLERPLSMINGDGRDLTAYLERDDSVTAVQFQSGALGENLQLAKHAVYMSPPLDSILFEQSLARIRRIGQQSDTCFYYYLVTKGSIEEHIYETLKKRKDFTQYLFEELED